MSDAKLRKAIRDMGWGEKLQPPEVLRQLESLSRTVDPTGALFPSAAAPFIVPHVFQWGPGSTQRQRVARAGKLTVMAAYAATAPTTGDAIITMSRITSSSGATNIASLVMDKGTQFAEASFDISLPGGAWILATLSTANGAANVSMSASVSGGS
jgi:hypothetical protein